MQLVNLEYFDHFSSLTESIKRVPLTGELSHSKLEPSFRKKEYSKSLFESTKKAAVLILFYPKFNKTHFILIKRNSYKGVHSNQIAFPGGKPEKFDNNLKDTALREANEEVGIFSDDITIIKALTPIYIPPSQFYVQPYMGILRYTPKFKKQTREVSSILEIPLLDLFNNQLQQKTKILNSNNKIVEAPAFNFNNHIVWGATAMVLSEVKDILDLVLQKNNY